MSLWGRFVYAASDHGKIILTSLLTTVLVVSAYFVAVEYPTSIPLPYVDSADYPSLGSRHVCQSRKFSGGFPRFKSMCYDSIPVHGPTNVTGILIVFDKNIAGKTDRLIFTMYLNGSDEATTMSRYRKVLRDNGWTTGDQMEESRFYTENEQWTNSSGVVLDVAFDTRMPPQGHRSIPAMVGVAYCP